MAANFEIDTSEELGSDGMDKSDKSHRRIKGSSEFDETFSKRSWREDTTLIVEDKRVYASSSILSLMSPVFTKMFEEENNEDMTFELKGKIYCDIIEFLQCIYPNVLKHITIENISSVLPLAVEYDVQSLKEKCRAFLKKLNDGDITALDICKIIQLILDCKLDDQSVHDTFVRHAINKGIEAILEVDEKYPLPLNFMKEIQNGVIQKLQEKLADSKMELTNIKPEYNMLRQIDFKRLWFGDIAIPILEDVRVGYLTLVVKRSNTIIQTTSPAITLHQILWQILINTKANKNKLGVFLKGSPAVEETKSWISKVYSKILVRNKKVVSDKENSFVHDFTESVPNWGYPEFIDFETLFDEDEGFLNRREEVTIDIQFLVGKPNFNM